MSVRIDHLTRADTALIVTALAVLAPRIEDPKGQARCKRLAKDISDGLPDRQTAGRDE